jgi:hypothetical protein
MSRPTPFAESRRARVLAPARRRGPACWSLVVAFTTYLLLGWAMTRLPHEANALSWYASVMWTAPILTAVLGVTGAVVAGRRTGRTAERRSTPRAVDDRLVVVVPTIGRDDTCTALARVLDSFVRHLPSRFSAVRVDVVIEENCEAQAAIQRMSETDPAIRVLVVPRTYRTQHGSRFKARANHYAHELRLAEGEATDDTWVLHMDDDTAVGPDTAEELACFVAAQAAAGDGACHLAQGVLCYPRELAAHRLVWLADSVRPACDLSIFAATTGLGHPRMGLHGELLLVRASVEGTIGWDFGPAAIVEDAQFGLEFCGRYPGRSAWFAGRSYGASPTTVTDFLRQRERWAWGLLALVADRTLPLRQRLLLLQAVAVWVCGPVQHPAVVLGVGVLLGGQGVSAVQPALLPIWSLNMGFFVWLYWEGLKANADASQRSGRLWWEPAALLVLLPVFSMLECVGVARGTVRFLRREQAAFTVISKPA